MNIYMYPISDPSKSTDKNPYIDNVIESIEENNCIVVNKGKVSKLGVLDLLCYVNKVDTYYLNFIESISDRRFGVIQLIFFGIIFLLLKLFRKRVVWVLHDKISHVKSNLFLKVITNYILLNYSDIVLTHAKEGITFGNSFLKKEKSIHFIHHPLSQKTKIKEKKKKDIDILIWGAISSYKAVDIFLKHLKEHDFEEKYKIHIAGKIKSDELKNVLKEYENDNITIENEFVSNERLQELHERAKIVLFTYAGYSTLSSASLMDSLAYGNFVIGPNVGAFNDMKEEGLAETFLDYNDLIKKVDTHLLETHIDTQKLITFIKDNSWTNFGKKVCKILSIKHA